MDPNISVQDDTIAGRIVDLESMLFCTQGPFTGQLSNLKPANFLIPSAKYPAI